MCNSVNREIIEITELANQEWIRMLGNKYLGILEADTNQQAEMKRNNKKSVIQMKEKASKLNCVAEISPKGGTPGQFSF